MVPMLAEKSPSVFESVTTIFSRPDTLAHPETLLQPLQSMSVVWAMFFVVLGIVCLVQGYRYYKTVTVALALAIGAFAGYALGERMEAAYIVAGCLGALMAIACYRRMQFAVPIMGGLAGAFIGANIWSGIAQFAAEDPTAAGQSHYWVGALIGLIMCGMLAFILFKVSVVLFTSVSGATIAVLGAVSLLLRVESFSPTVADSITAHSVIMPMLVFVPALIGFILQENLSDGMVEEGSVAKPAVG